MPNWGAMARPQQPPCSVAHWWKLERQDRGDPGVLQVSLRTQNRLANRIVTGNNKHEGSIFVHSPLLQGMTLAFAREGSGGPW